MRDSIPERVAPALRDGTEAEISHTFPVLAMCRRDSRVDREPGEPADAEPLRESARRSVCAHRVLKPRYAMEANRRFPTRSPFPRGTKKFPKDRLPSHVLWDLSRAFPVFSSLSRVPLFSRTVTKEELQKLLPGCSTILV